MHATHLLAFSSFFSAWGDRMWSFAVSLYMIKLTPGSLRLAAIYGLVTTSFGIIFAPVIGHLIDHSQRLKVVRISLIIQNTLVCLCALSVLAIFYNVFGDDYIVIVILKSVVILLGALANLIGQGEKISISKDWIIVVCNNDEDVLARTNALFRRIDLTVAILAPVVVGVLMSTSTIFASAIFICAWNVFSVIAEYLFLLKVYHDVPELANKFEARESDHSNENMKLTEKEINNVNKSPSHVSQTKSVKSIHHHFNFYDRFKQVILGWKVYRRQTVVLAGISLSVLYLTVLGFNEITTGYAYALGLNEFQTSLCYCIAALFGIIGTFIYTTVRKRIGLAKTGLIGFLIQWSSLLLCVVSLWLPGSISILYPSRVSQVDASNTHDNTTLVSRTRVFFNTTDTPYSDNVDTNNETVYTSILVFITGLIVSRAGLWLIDLTITQLQQENVPEEERGIVSGVQYSFNSILDLLQFPMTIILPKTEQFGILIIVSVISVTIAAVIYKVFVYKFLSYLQNIDELAEKEIDV